MRILVMKFYESPDSPPVEVGRAWVDSSGRAVLQGFSPEVVRHYETLGVYNPRGARVPMSDGETFLRLLISDYDGSRMITEEEEAPDA